MNTEKLFALADRAKTIGGGQEYALPNAVFCVLLEALFKGEEGAQNVILNLETEDPNGECARQAHYDLFVLRLVKEGRDLELCIPVPLIATVSAVAMTKRAIVLARGEHRRSYRAPEEEEILELWKELQKEVPVDRLLEAVNRHLTIEALREGHFYCFRDQAVSA